MRFFPLPLGTTSFVVTSIILMLILAAWGTYKHPEALWAPGNLSRYHSDITACSDCHQAFRGAQADKCITCHDEKKFSALSKPKVTEFHQRAILEKKSCIDCHTEHRGELAQITVGALFNPHGEFVFRVTGTHSCSACHDNSGNSESKMQLLNNAVVSHLMEKGNGGT
jgi:hypothetical protein